LCYQSKEFVVNWFRRCGFSSHVGECLALALVILLTFALCVALLRLVFGLLKCQRDTDESERECWRIHGGWTCRRFRGAPPPQFVPWWLTTVDRNPRRPIHKAKSSGTRCQVSRVTWHGWPWNYRGHRLFQEEESEFVPIASRSLRFAYVSVRCREWNCSCSNWVMRTLALRDPLTLKEQT